MNPRKIAASFLLAIVACNGAPASTTNTSATSLPAETTVPTEGTIPTEGTVLPSTSEEVAAAFVEAWRSADQATMEQLAEPEAVSQANDLERLATDTWEFSLCEGAAGTVFCTWTSKETDNIVVGVRNIVDPHVVTSFTVAAASLG